MSNIRTVTGAATLVRDTEPIAKNAHVCYLCNRDIAAGEKYSNVCIALYGEIQTIKTHFRCVSIAEHIHSYFNMLPDAGLDNQDFMDLGMTYYRDYRHNPEDSELYKTCPEHWEHLKAIHSEWADIFELSYDERCDQDIPGAEE